MVIIMKTQEQIKDSVDKIITNSKEYGISMNRDEYLREILFHQLMTIEGYKEQRKGFELKIEELNSEVQRLSGFAPRECVPIKDRTIDILFTKKEKATLYFNPCSGKIVVYLPQNTAPGFKTKIIAIADDVKKNDGFKPYTYRGAIAYNKESGKVYCNLRGDGVTKGISSIHFEVKGE